MNKVFADSVSINGNIFSPARNFPTIGSFVTSIVTNSIVIAGVIAFIFIILGGFAILSGAGNSDPKQLEQGKKTLTMAVAGLLIVVFSLWFIQALRIFIGFDPLNPPGT